MRPCVTGESGSLANEPCVPVGQADRGRLVHGEPSGASPGLVASPLAATGASAPCHYPHSHDHLVVLYSTQGHSA
jgi:hypothetical protein